MRAVRPQCAQSTGSGGAASVAGLVGLAVDAAWGVSAERAEGGDDAGVKGRGCGRGAS